MVSFKSALTLIFATCVLAAGATIAHAQPGGSDGLRRDIDTAKERVYPAIVNISVTMRFYSGGRAMRAPAGGSGVIVSADGYVLTNFHVAGHATRIVCRIPDGESIDAKVVLHDALTDLSVLKLDLSRRDPTAKPIPFAKLGDSDQMRTGDYVVAMGNPLTLSSSITLGIISNTQRVFTDFTGTEIESRTLEEGETTGLLTRWIQHDALILPGNSGGPLANLKGEVIGINELGGSGFGFAIPSNLAASVLKQAISGKPLVRAWLGFAVLPTDKLAEKKGALISSVLKGSPAEKAGMKAGDILLSLGKEPVNARFFEEIPLLYQSVAALAPGVPVAITYLRNGASCSGEVTPSPMEESVGREDEFRDLGVTLQEITGPMAVDRLYPDRKGLVVTGVRAGYSMESAHPPIAEGDVVFRVDGTAVNSLDEFRKTVAAGGKRDMLFAFRRGRELMVTVVKPKAEPIDEDSQELPKAWLGIKTQVVTPELVKALGLTGVRGFRVTRVYPWSQAAKSGVRAGDILTAIEKQRFTASRPQDEKEIDQAVENLSVGQMAQFTGLRDGKPISFVVKMEAQPQQVSQAKKSTDKDFEFMVRDLVATDIDERSLSADQKGALVVDVTQGGWASISGMKVNDIILSINGKTTADSAACETAMAEIKKARPASVLFFILRDNMTHYLFGEPEWKTPAGSE